MRRKLGWVVGGVVAIALALLVATRAGRYLPAFVAWAEGWGAWGPLAFVAIYAASTIALVPASFLTVASGALFGLLWGTVYAFLGATLGATGAFLASRHLVREKVERHMSGNRRFRRIDRAIQRQGRRVVFLVRLSPVFPFTILNYALGLTRVRTWDYVVASLGMIPGTLLYVYAGALVGEVAALSGEAAPPRGVIYYTVLGLGLIATVGVVVLVTRIARRALAEETGEGRVERGGGRKRPRRPVDDPG